MASFKEQILASHGQEVTRAAITALPARYEPIAVLGEGGMGVVFDVRERDTGRSLAVKVLNPNYLGTYHYRERFQSEGEIARALTHKHIVKVERLEMFPPSGVPFFVMERLDGCTLFDHSRANHELPVVEVIDLALQALDALDFVHRNGIVHRDVKLSNLMLVPTNDGQVLKLIDFGIAKVLKPNPELYISDRTFETAHGSHMGTAGYASPEQASGEVVDYRTDLYSLGIVLYTLIAGKGPFDGIQAPDEILRAHVYRNPAAPSSTSSLPVPPQLDEIILKALAKRPDDRFATAAAFAESLKELRANMLAPVGFLKTTAFFPWDPKNKLVRGPEPPKTVLTTSPVDLGDGADPLPPLAFFATASEENTGPRTGDLLARDQPPSVLPSSSHEGAGVAEQDRLDSLTDYDASLGSDRSFWSRAVYWLVAIAVVAALLTLAAGYFVSKVMP